MSESIVVIRLTRNLRYKLTYVKIFETYLELETEAAVVELLKGLIQAQHAAIAPLSSFLRRLDVKIENLDLNDKLMAHALERTDVRSRLRFIYDGLERAVSWYRMQLVDRQMTADLELQGLLLELGELDAAKLWRTGAVMAMLHIPEKPREKDWAAERIPDPTNEEQWRSRLLDETHRPTWGREQQPASRWSRQQPKPRRRRP